MQGGPAFDAPHVFAEKQIISVEIPNAYMEGGEEVIPYTYCEVFAPSDIVTQV